MAIFRDLKPLRSLTSTAASKASKTSKTSGTSKAFGTVRTMSTVRTFRPRTALTTLTALTVLTAAVILSSGCSSTVAVMESVKSLGKEVDITSSLGISATNGEYTEILETHGGFHGDGVTYSTVQFSDDSAVEGIKKSDGWHELPMSENVNILVYGAVTDMDGTEYHNGPYFTDDDGNTLAPEVENGYYFFMDRQAEDEDKRFDDSQVLDRNSYNCTVAIYDTDTDTLHYLKLDT